MSRAKLYIGKISNKLRKPDADAKSADDELELTDAATDGEDILTASLYNLMPEDIDVSTKEKKKKKTDWSMNRKNVKTVRIVTAASHRSRTKTQKARAAENVARTVRRRPGTRS